MESHEQPCRLLRGSRRIHDAEERPLVDVQSRLQPGGDKRLVTATLLAGRIRGRKRREGNFVGAILDLLQEAAFPAYKDDAQGRVALPQSLKRRPERFFVHLGREREPCALVELMRFGVPLRKEPSLRREKRSLPQELSGGPFRAARAGLMRKFFDRGALKELLRCQGDSGPRRSGADLHAE